MDEPPAQPHHDGPENAMLVEYEWRPSVGHFIPAMLSAEIFHLGTPVDEDAAPDRHSWHQEPAAENCRFNVEWENGTQVEHQEEVGWVIKGTDDGA